MEQNLILSLIDLDISAPLELFIFLFLPNKIRSLITLSPFIIKSRFLKVKSSKEEMKSKKKV